MYSQFVRRIVYPLHRWWGGDRAELKYLQEFERTQFLPPSTLRTLQLERLKRLISHAYAHCPFYRQRLDTVGILPSDIRSLDDLGTVPVLTKQDIQQYRDAMVAENWPHDDLVPNQTGGSTGTPLSFFVPRERMLSRTAATWRHNRWAGYDIGDSAALIWGALRDVAPPTWKSRIRTKLIDRTVLLNTASITETDLRIFHDKLLQLRPRVILAYAKSITMFARYLKSHEISGYQPQAIISSAEVLEPEERSLIEDVFGCRVFNRYGCREVSVIASECEERRGLHVMAEGLYVEVSREGRPAQPGELGAVLITDLLNLGMPLIRYQIGDMAIAKGGDCACGRGLPCLQDISGRVTDFLVGSEGQLISGALLTVAVVAKRPSLGQVQIWQETRGKIRYKIVLFNGRPPSTEDLRFVVDETRHYLGHQTEVEFEFVDHLDCEPSGKYLFSRSFATCDFVDKGSVN